MPSPSRKQLLPAGAQSAAQDICVRVGFGSDFGGIRVQGSKYLHCPFKLRQFVGQDCSVVGGQCQPETFTLTFNVEAAGGTGLSGRRRGVLCADRACTDDENIQIRA